MRLARDAPVLARRLWRVARACAASSTPRYAAGASSPDGGRDRASGAHVPVARGVSATPACSRRRPPLITP